MPCLYRNTRNIYGSKNAKVALMVVQYKWEWSHYYYGGADKMLSFLNSRKSYFHVLYLSVASIIITDIYKQQKNLHYIIGGPGLVSFLTNSSGVDAIIRLLFIYWKEQKIRKRKSNNEVAETIGRSRNIKFVVLDDDLKLLTRILLIRRYRWELSYILRINFKSWLTRNLFLIWSSF